MKYRNKRIDTIDGKFKEKDIINGWHYNRMSMVMYLREKMIKCKDKKLWKNKKGGAIINANYSSDEDSDDSIETQVINSLPEGFIEYMREKYGMFIR